MMMMTDLFLVILKTTSNLFLYDDGWSLLFTLLHSLPHNSSNWRRAWAGQGSCQLVLITSHAGCGEVLRRQVPDGSAERVHLGAEGHRLHPAEDAAGAQQVGGQHDSGKLGEKARPTSVVTLLREYGVIARSC